MKKLNFLVIAVVTILLSLAVSSASYAIPVKYVDVNPGRVAYTNWGNFWAGIYNLEVGGTGQHSFCIDLYNYVPPSTQEYEIENLSTRYSSKVAQDISMLWYNNYLAATTNANTAAGLQIAIWEVTQDSNYNIWDTTSSFYIKSGSDYGAQDMLNALSSGSGYANLIALTNDNYQDFVVQKVPEPAIMLLLGTGLLGLGWYSRRRSKHI